MPLPLPACKQLLVVMQIILNVSHLNLDISIHKQSPNSTKRVILNRLSRNNAKQSNIHAAHADRFCTLITGRVAYHKSVKAVSRLAEICGVDYVIVCLHADGVSHVAEWPHSSCLLCMCCLCGVAKPCRGSGLPQHCICPQTHWP